MCIFKKLILILCVVSILNFGGAVCSTNASIISDDFSDFQITRLQTKVLKVVFVGNRNAGKTACRSALIGQSFDFLEKNPTLCSSFAPITYKIPIGSDAIRVEYWDTTGINANENLFQQVMNERARDAHFMIVTIDFSEVCTPEGLPKLRTFTQDWLEPIESINPRTHVILLGTKLDVAQEMVNEGVTSQRIFDKAQSLIVEAANNFNHFSAVKVIPLFVSAKTGENIDLLLYTIAKATLTDEDDLYNHLPLYFEDGMTFESASDSILAPEIKAQKEQREREQQLKLQQTLDGVYEKGHRTGFKDGHKEGYQDGRDSKIGCSVL